MDIPKPGTPESQAFWLAYFEKTDLLANMASLVWLLGMASFAVGLVVVATAIVWPPYVFFVVGCVAFVASHRLQKICNDRLDFARKAAIHSGQDQ